MPGSGRHPEEESMTIQLKARDVALAVLLGVAGLLIGLSFGAAPSQAQNVGGQASYIESGGQYWYCAGRDCVPVRFNQFG